MTKDKTKNELGSDDKELDKKEKLEEKTPETSKEEKDVTPKADGESTPPEKVIKVEKPKRLAKFGNLSVYTEKEVEINGKLYTERFCSDNATYLELK
jgi:hypothetical protein